MYGCGGGRVLSFLPKNFELLRWLQDDSFLFPNSLPQGPFFRVDRGAYVWVTGGETWSADEDACVLALMCRAQGDTAPPLVLWDTRMLASLWMPTAPI
eukprot:4471612-Karenia_brevis.AAC.1